ncbi:hypothetical protein ACLF6K_06950 [Streptomyces xanthophaeus]|uniref:hypothetical protein n=1 Tax=Streptomyces xanthophaeus TaxID=67385 RepID=UPI00398FE366
MMERVPARIWAAQRRIASTVHASGVLCGGGLGLWRETTRGDGQAGVAEIARDLSALKVPHQVVAAYRPSLARQPGRVRCGEEVRIATKDLGRLVRLMPSLQRHLDQIPADAWGFSFIYFKPRAEGMTTMLLSAFACEWPHRTEQQASAMGLMCAQCGYDLRRRQDDRAPYNIPLPAQPTRRRLLCGQCCNNGLEHLAALAPEPS